MDRDDSGVPVFMTDEKWDMYLDLTAAVIDSYRAAGQPADGSVRTDAWAATEMMAQDPLAATAVILCLLHHAAKE